MRLSDILLSYVDRNIEVFLDSGYYEGLLVSVNDLSIEIQMTSGYGNGPAAHSNIILSKIKQLRVIKS